MMRHRGKGPRQFGEYEAKQVLSWMSLVWAVATAVVGWGIAELVPWLESQEGFVATLGGLAAILLRAAQQWLADNQNKVG